MLPNTNVPHHTLQNSQGERAKIPLSFPLIARNRLVYIHLFFLMNKLLPESHVLKSFKVDIGMPQKCGGNKISDCHVAYNTV